jgi:hypothetical protein
MDLTRRSFAHRLVGGLFVASLIACALLYASSSAREALRVRAALKASEADERGGTAARVVRGVVTENTNVASVHPGHVGWAAHVGRWKGSSKSQTYVVTCVITRVDGLRLENGTTHESVVLEGFDARAGDFAEGLSIDDPGRAAVDLWRADPPAPVVQTTEYDVPEPLRTLCKGSMPPGSFDYAERWVEVGNEVTVRGCALGKKTGTDVVITPCGDGLDAVTTSDLAALRRATRDQHAASVAYGAGAAFVGLGILGILASIRLVRSSCPREDGP